MDQKLQLIETTGISCAAGNLYVTKKFYRKVHCIFGYVTRNNCVCYKFKPLLVECLNS